MKLEFWYEFASTYSHLTAQRIEGRAAEASVELRWRPFLLGPIFQAQGWNDSPFNLYPAKGRYMWRDLERRAAGYGISFRKPSQFPRNALLAARVTLVAEAEGFAPEFSRAVYRANFADDRDIADPGVIETLLGELGQNPSAVLDRAAAQQNKAALREQTELASQRGIFGAPSFWVNGELFWGDDRLEEALAFARG